MNQAAFATYKISKSINLDTGRAGYKIILDVDSISGWLGGCVMWASSKQQAQEIAYSEADRRACAQGLRLEWIEKQ